MDLPATRPTLIDRARQVIQRALGIGIEVWSGSSGVGAQPDYPMEAAEAAFATNPWVYTCIQAIATDLSGVPLVAETGTGINRRQDSDHWLLRLIEHPHPKLGGRKFRKQLVADLAGYRNAYIRVWRDGNGRPYQLGRIHPSTIKAKMASDGEVLGWVIGGRELPWNAVRHIADISLASSESYVYGESPVRALALGLQVDRDSRRHAGRSAKRGRLEMMVSPTEQGVSLGKDQINKVTEGYRDAVENGHGLYVVGMGMSASPLSLTARDAEFLGILDRSRAEVLAAFSVPETRAGGPAANYGTSKQQMRMYWESLQGMAALIDDELSALADDGTRIRHVFSQVESLQTSRTEQQARGATWITSYGLSPQDAARYEGFVDMPEPVREPAGVAPIAPSQDTNPPADQPHAARAVDEIGTVLRTAAPLFGKDADIDAAARSLEAMLLRALMRNGTDQTRALDVASEAAGVCSEASLALSTIGEVYTSPAFGVQHAHRIARLAGLAA